MTLGFSCLMGRRRLSESTNLKLLCPHLVDSNDSNLRLQIVTLKWRDNVTACKLQVSLGLFQLPNTPQGAKLGLVVFTTATVGDDAEGELNNILMWRGIRKNEVQHIYFHTFLVRILKSYKNVSMSDMSSTIFHFT